MNIERIRQRVSDGGFRPFKLRLSDGSRVAVPHPEFIILGKNVVVVVERDDRTHILDPLHIVAIEERRQRTKAS